MLCTALSSTASAQIHVYERLVGLYRECFRGTWKRERVGRDWRGSATPWTKGQGRQSMDEAKGAALEAERPSEQKSPPRQLLAVRKAWISGVQ